MPDVSGCVYYLTAMCGGGTGQRDGLLDIVEVFQA